MVLNIDLFRSEKGGNPEVIRESQKRRYKDPSVVDKIIEKDETWRKGSLQILLLKILTYVFSSLSG